MSVIEIKILIDEVELRKIFGSPASLLPLTSVPLQKKAESSLLTTAQVAKLLNVSNSSVNNYKRAGKLPFHRIGRKILFKEDEVMESLKKING